MSSGGLTRRRLFCADASAATMKEISITISTAVVVKPCHVCCQAEVQPEVGALQLPREGFRHVGRRGEATKKGIGFLKPYISPFTGVGCVASFGAVG